jgi:hypothetical protein
MAATFARGEGRKEREGRKEEERNKKNEEGDVGEKKAQKFLANCTHT